MYCRKCKKIYTGSASFCACCGQKLEDELNVYGEEFRAGKQEAFEKIYVNTERWVRSYVYNRIPETDIDDCIQNIYIKLYEKIDKFNPESGEFRPWFNTMVKNETIDYARKFQSKFGKNIPLYTENGEEETEMEFADLSAIPEDLIDKQETVKLIQEILNDLPDDQRICLLLYYKEGLKQSEIAQQLSITEGTVKSRLHYGKKKVEDKVLELEKSGTKLYGIAPFVFFVRLLRSETDYVPSSGSNVWEVISSAVSKFEQKSVESTVAETIGSSSAKAAGAMAGKTIGTKAIVGIIAAVVIGTGGIAGYKVTHHQNVNGEESVIDAENSSKEENKKTDADSGKDETAENVPEDIKSMLIYGDTIEQYIEQLNIDDFDEFYEENEKNPTVDFYCNPKLLSAEYGKVTAEMVGFCFKDLDLDGTKELLLFGNEQSPHPGLIYDVFAVHEGSVEQILFGNDIYFAYLTQDNDIIVGMDINISETDGFRVLTDFSNIGYYFWTEIDYFYDAESDEYNKYIESEMTTDSSDDTDMEYLSSEEAQSEIQSYKEKIVKDIETTPVLEFEAADIKIRQSTEDDLIDIKNYRDVYPEEFGGNLPEVLANEICPDSPEVSEINNYFKEYSIDNGKVRINLGSEAAGYSVDVYEYVDNFAIYGLKVGMTCDQASEILEQQNIFCDEWDLYEIGDNETVSFGSVNDIVTSISYTHYLYSDGIE